VLHAPLRVDVAILILLILAGALVYAIVRARRGRRRPVHGIRVDLTGGPSEPPAGP
jgi:uncharacterized membrane protein